MGAYSKERGTVCYIELQFVFYLSFVYVCIHVGMHALVCVYVCMCRVCVCMYAPCVCACVCIKYACNSCGVQRITSDVIP